MLRAVVIVLGLGAILLLSLQLATQAKVTSLILTEFNKQLNAEIKVRDVKFSLFRRFPQASVILHDVYIPEVNNPEGIDTLFHCKTLLLQFRIFDLIKPKKDISRIEVRDGGVNIKFFKDGSLNYDILKASDDSNANPLLLKLNRVVVKNTNVWIHFDDPNQDYSFDVHSARISGSVNDQTLKFKSKSHGITRQIDVEGLQFVPGAMVEVELEFTANLALQKYELDVPHLLIEDQELTLKGTIEDAKRKLDLSISGEGLSLEKGLYYLPASLKESWPEYEFDIHYSAKCSIKGSYARNELPTVIVDFKTEPGSVKKLADFQDGRTGEIRGSVYYMDPTLHEDLVLNVSQFETSFGSDTLKGSFRVDGMELPTVNCIISGAIEPGNYLHYLNIKSLDTLEGRVQLSASLYIPKLSIDSLPTTISTIKGKAEISFDDLLIAAKDSKNPIQHCTGIVKWENGTIPQAKLVAETPYGRISAKGFLSSMEGLYDGMQSAVEGSFILSCPLLTYHSEHEGGREGESYTLPNLDALSLSLQVNVDSFIIDDYSGRNLKGTVVIQGSDVSFNELYVKVYGGDVKGRGSLIFSQYQNTSFAMEVETRGIDISKVFHAADNFDQSSLTEHNIAGRVSSEIRMTGELDSLWEPVWDALIVDAHVKIEDGKLFDFKPIESIAKYIRVDDLNRISFATLENDLQVRQSEVIIPEMRIVSTATSMTISGVQKFDGEMDYHLMVSLSDVLGAKAKRNPENLNYIEVGEGGIDNIFLQVTGTVEDPVVKYDRREARSAINRSLTQQKNEVKSVLHEEFGLFKKNPPPAQKEPEKKPKYTLEIPD